MSSGVATERRFILSPSQAERLAAQYGTPLYVLDEAHFRERIRTYLRTFKSAYANSELTFASKANSTLAVLAIAHQEGCLIDVASEGEFRAALAAGVPASRCHMHGNNKSKAEIEFAFEERISQIVVDNFSEIEVIAAMSRAKGFCPELILRLAPGVDPKTHAKISTGQADTKFGFNIADGSAERATVRCLELDLPLKGYHCHVGSQLLDAEAQVGGGELITGFAVQMKQKHGFAAEVINFGGGLGVHYVEGQEPIDVETYTKQVVGAVLKALEGSGLTPKLTQEPGRSLIAESGVTLYRVGVKKTVPVPEIGSRTYLCVDGGLSDNPRPALYGSKYEVRVLGKQGSSRAKFTISGKHCETDLLFPDVELDAAVEEGDLLQVLCTGGYNSSMASNYNRYPRPATAMIRESGEFALVQRRDDWDEMFAREFVPEDFR